MKKRTVAIWVSRATTTPTIVTRIIMSPEAPYINPKPGPEILEPPELKILEPLTPRRLNP